MAKRVPPFYENFDNTHCAQCVLRGILEYFEPSEVWDWAAWDKFTGKEPDKWTWPERGQINMAERGYSVKAIGKENLNLYVEKGIREALVEMFGEETAKIQIEMSPDLDVVQRDIASYLEHPAITYEQRVPTLEDVRQLLSEGYLLCSSLNSYVLDGKTGYSSHMVLIYDIDGNNVYIQDSGLPAKSERRVEIATFLAASTNPTDEQWSIQAFKLEKNNG